MDRKNKSILLCGIQKVGNTHARFVIFNYFNILNHDAEKTLTWEELEEPHLLRQKHGLDYDYNDGYPLVFHTHNARDGQGIFEKYDNHPEYFDQFDKMIYVYRNPYDTCISYFHFMMDRDILSFEKSVSVEELEKLKTLEGFSKWFLPKYIHHLKTTIKYADLILDYDSLRKDTKGFYKLMELIIDDVDYDILEKSIEMSSFDNIKKMSIDIKQPYGLGGPNYKGFFCRDGRSDQYKKVMSKELQEWIKERFDY